MTPRPAYIAILLATAATGASAEDVDIGGLVLSVSDSWTAQLFHIVDQLSEWDEASHRQYGRWARKSLTLDDEDRKLLQDHARLRRKRGWNSGFEQSFYTDAPLERAAQNAIDLKLLNSEEAMAEKVILLHFAPKLSILRDQGAPQIASFRQRLSRDRERVAPVVQQLFRFSETTDTVKVPVFLVPNPEPGNAGGGFNGGRLVLEVQEQPDPISMLFHESLHVLLTKHKDAIEAAAKSAGLSFGALNEGITYAFAPGLVDPVADSDSLGEALVRSVLRGAPASDGYVQAYSVAVLLRPLLRASMQRGETFSAFLPQAVAKWRTRLR